MKFFSIKILMVVGLVAVSVLGFSKQVFAQSWLESSWGQLEHAAGKTGADLGEPVDPRLIVANIIKLALSLIATILFVLIAYSGYKWMTAQGNENSVAEAKTTITNATIGLVIILSAYALTILITNLALGRKLDSNASQGGDSLDSAVESGASSAWDTVKGWFQ